MSTYLEKDGASELNPVETKRIRPSPPYEASSFARNKRHCGSQRNNKAPSIKLFPPESSLSSFGDNTSSESSTSTTRLSDLSFNKRSSSSSSSSNDSFFSDDYENISIPLQLYSHVRNRHRRRRTRRKSFQEGIGSFWDIVPFKKTVKVLGPEKFKKSFRMSYPTFKLLLSQVRDLLHRPLKRGTEYRRCKVPPEIRLAITLRILGGGSYIDLMLAYHIEECTIRRIFHQTCDVLTSRLQLKRFPKTMAGMRQIARNFQSSRRGTNPLPGCVGALDGICIKIKKPQPCENPAMFYCRKGFYAIPVQALVDSDYIFRFCSAVCTGATHDALAFSVSGLKREIDRGALFHIFYIVGDDAYSLTNHVIIPCSKANADVDQDNFNCFQSSHRMHIEQAFGMLVSRWRILKGGLQYSVKRSTIIICLLMKLNNFILENDTSRSIIVHTLSQGDREALEVDIDHWCRESRELACEFQSRRDGERCDHDGVLQSVQQRIVSTSKRDMLIEIVKRKCRDRPQVQLYGYRASQDRF